MASFSARDCTFDFWTWEYLIPKFLFVEIKGVAHVYLPISIPNAEFHQQNKFVVVRLECVAIFVPNAEFWLQNTLIIMRIESVAIFVPNAEFWLQKNHVVQGYICSQNSAQKPIFVTSRPRPAFGRPRMTRSTGSKFSKRT